VLFIRREREWRNVVRNPLIGVLVGFLIVVPIASQQRPESIEIGGVLLQIGTTKDSVISKLAQEGLTIKPISDGGRYSDPEERTWRV
jgi:hypothetical protein